MSEKIYCKDCRFYSDTLGTCHKFPPQPMFDIHNKSMGHPYVCDNDWCGMAERREEAGPEFIVAGKIEAGDAVYICKHGEMEKLEGEKHKLKVAVQFLVNEMKSFCNCFGLNGNCARFDCRGCYQTCEIYKDIKRYDCLEDGK